MHCIAEPWPGIPIPMKGTHRTTAERQEDCSWAPLIAGLTPHGLRHGHQTAMRRDASLWSSGASASGQTARKRAGVLLPGGSICFPQQQSNRDARHRRAGL